MSDAILKRGVKPFDIVVRMEDDDKVFYVVKEPMNDRGMFFLVRDEYAKRMDYNTLSIVTREELVENFEFDWENQGGLND